MRFKGLCKVIRRVLIHLVTFVCFFHDDDEASDVLQRHVQHFFVLV